MQPLVPCVAVRAAMRRACRRGIIGAQTRSLSWQQAATSLRRFAHEKATLHVYEHHGDQQVVTACRLQCAARLGVCLALAHACKEELLWVLLPRLKLRQEVQAEHVANDACHAEEHCFPLEVPLKLVHIQAHAV